MAEPEQSPLAKLIEEGYQAELAQIKLLSFSAPVEHRLVLDFLEDGTVHTTPVSSDHLRLAGLVQAFVRQCLENPGLITLACELEAEGEDT